MHEYLQHRRYLYGKQWNGISSILPTQYITPDRCTDPCMSETVPNTFLDSQLHLMHLNYLTWFNGASPTGGAHWLTIWCSNDLRAIRSLGCLAPPSGCLRDLFSLISSLSTVTPPGRWNRKEVLCYGKNKEHLTGICNNSEAWTQATWLRSPFWFKQSLANFWSGLDAVVFIHLL